MCGGISYIPKVARGSKQSKHAHTVKLELIESRKALSQTKFSIQKTLTTAEDEKSEHLKLIANYTDRLMRHVRYLETFSVDSVIGRHKKTSDKLRSRIRSLDDAAAAMTDRIKHLENVKTSNESQVFIDIKQGQHEVNNAKQLKQDLTPASTRKVMPDLVMREDVDYFLNEVPFLCQYLQEACKTTLFGEYDVGMQGKESVCYITDICEISAGAVLIADNANSCIKKLDKSYKVTECLNMPPRPYGICQTGDNAVAVTLTVERKVQFVNVKGKFKMSVSFKVEDRCRGICYSRGELFVCCGGHPGNQDYAAEGPGLVAVYSMSGSLLRKIQFDYNGKQIFSRPHYITATDNGHKLHIADPREGVITVDRRGRVLSTFSTGLEGTAGVCSVTEDTFLVCGHLSKNIIQIDSDVELVAELLGEKDGISSPWSVSFLRRSSRLVLSQGTSNTILVFNMTL